MKIKMKKTKLGLSLNVKKFDIFIVDIDNELDELMFNIISVDSFERQGRRGLVVSKFDDLNFVTSYDLDKKEMTIKEVYNNNFFFDLMKNKTEEEIKCWLYKIASYSIGKACLGDRSGDIIVHEPLKVA